MKTHYMKRQTNGAYAPICERPIGKKGGYEYDTVEFFKQQFRCENCERKIREGRKA